MFPAHAFYTAYQRTSELKKHWENGTALWDAIINTVGRSVEFHQLISGVSGGNPVNWNINQLFARDAMATNLQGMCPQNLQSTRDRVVIVLPRVCNSNTCIRAQIIVINPTELSSTGYANFKRNWDATGMRKWIASTAEEGSVAQMYYVELQAYDETTTPVTKRELVVWYMVPSLESSYDTYGRSTNADSDGHQVDFEFQFADGASPVYPSDPGTDPQIWKQVSARVYQNMVPGIHQSVYGSALESQDSGRNIHVFRGPFYDGTASSSGSSSSTTTSSTSSGGY
jgi:hypothetical protein